MHRFFRPASFGAALLALCATRGGAHAAELDFNTLEVPAETQSNGPVRPQASTLAHLAPSSGDAETLPKAPQRAEVADPGGAVFMPFAEPPESSTAKDASHAKPARASQGLDVPDLALTLVAVLVGVASLAWLLRRA
jgi:hypothetical protein